MKLDYKHVTIMVGINFRVPFIFQREPKVNFNLVWCWLCFMHSEMSEKGTGRSTWIWFGSLALTIFAINRGEKIWSEGENFIHLFAYGTCVSAWKDNDDDDDDGATEDGRYKATRFGFFSSVLWIYDVRWMRVNKLSDEYLVTDYKLQLSCYKIPNSFS